jgi:2-dehydro-3-deoxygalactonokinase
MNQTIKPDWIAADWGTSNLRVWAMSNAGEILAEAQSGDGMGTLSQPEFEPALLRLISTWLSEVTPVIACGMVGSRQGWQEAPYRAVPCAPCDGSLTQIETSDPRLKVYIIPGLKQHKPADVMRGEETQIAGYIAAHPNFDGVICLPGTHSKWAHISAKECVSFQTFMTGEIFSCLTEQSVLRHSVRTKDWSDAAFDSAVQDAIANPTRMAATLFSLRADSLLHDLPAGEARGRLSGLLIGAELAAARPYWLGQEIVLIGAPKLSALYARALTLLGCAPLRPEAQNLTLAGLSAAYISLKETSI